MSGAHGVILSQNNYIAPTRTAVNITIAADTQNYVLNTAKAAGYTAGTTDVTLTINSGIYVGSTSTGTVAFDVDTSWHANDTVTVVNNGFIVGGGGVGGRGSNDLSGTGAIAPEAGGPALRAQRAVSVTNLGTIGGGGGGGGYGLSGFNMNWAPYQAPGGNGGGGGAGYTPGAGGAAGVLDYSGNPGSSGTRTAGGAGGAPVATNGAGGFNEVGGTGGDLGQSGGASGGSSQPGAAGGNCTTSGSNALITWLSNGTRLGTIA